MTDIAPIKGLIELTDNFTSEIGLAEAALNNFTKTNQESLKAVAIAAGLVTGALIAIGVAAVELGKHGSEINDVNATLEHFAGSAQNAKADMDALRDGTKGTVDNFALAADAARLLSANVKLTADDFATLGNAAFVLQNRGLGGTKEQLDLVSDALVTGKTRHLALKLGVVENTLAEEDYAAKLGVTKDQLSQSGIAEAHRIEVFRILNAAVKDAGVQQRDFGEEIEFAKTQITNFVDDLASAVASSKVFAAGFKAIEEAVSGAFDGDKEAAIESVTHALEQGAIAVVGFAQDAITVARVVEGAWEGIRTTVLAVETVIVGFVAAVAISIADVAENLAALHIISPQTAAEVEGFRDQLKGMTVDLAKQTQEAAAAVFGHTEFDKTLDSLSASLSKVSNAMVDASAATTADADAANAASKNAAKLSGAQKDLNSSMIDGAKVTAALVKSTQELNAIWDDYFTLVAKNTKTSGAEQRQEIEATFNKQVAALDALDPLFTAKYGAYRATADAALKGIGSDFASVKDQSVEGLQEQADKAYQTYNDMINSSLHFTRDALDAQLAKYHDLQDAANGWSKKHIAAVTDAANAIQLLDHAWVTDGDIAAATINKTTIMVKTLSGELISLAEAQKRQQQGGSQDITSQNFESALMGLITSGGFNPSGAGSNINASQAYNYARQGYSFQEIIAIFAAQKTSNAPPPPPKGPRIPGFKDGGTVDIMVGEEGPEAMRVPLGTTVFPSGTDAPGGGTTIHNWYVNGSAVETAEKVKKIIMSQLKTGRKFGSA